MPRRNRTDEYDDDDFDDSPRRHDEKKPGLATAAAVLWLIWAGLLLVAFLVRAIILVSAFAMDDDVNPVCGCLDLLLVLGAGAWSGLAGLLTVFGKPRSLLPYGIFSLVLPPTIVLMETAISFFTGIEVARNLGRGQDNLPLMMGARGFCFSSLLVAGVILAGIFALVANNRYRAWHSRDESAAE